MSEPADDHAFRLRGAYRWATEGAWLKARHDRGIALAYALFGIAAFSDCSSLHQVCERTGVSARSMRHYLKALRVGYGLRPPASRLEDALPEEADPLAAPRDGEAA